MEQFQIVIDLLKLTAYKLTFSEYLTLLYIDSINQKRNYAIFYKLFTPTDTDYKSLIDKGYITSVLFNNSGYEIVGKTKVLFPDEDKVFIEFYEKFPHKVPDGQGGYRPVSTISVNNLSAKNTKKIWDSCLKLNPNMKNVILDCLDKELKYRESNGSLMYLPNIDTWLRNNSWEKWIGLNTDETANLRNNVRKL